MNSSAVQKSPIGFKLKLNKQNALALSAEGANSNINQVEVTISGEGLTDPVKKVLTISGDAAQGTVSIPPGQKKFDVSALLISNNIRFLLYNGSKSLNVTKDTRTVTINLNENTANDTPISWHDNSFETFFTGDVGVVFAAAFDVSGAGPLFVKKLAAHLSWGGNLGDYRIVLFTASEMRFRSVALGPSTTDGWVEWSLIYNQPEQGIFNNILIAGIEYENSTLPAIGFDTSNPSSSSWFWDPNVGSWQAVQDGDFGITVTVQSPTGGAARVLKPNIKLSDIYWNK